MSQDDNDAQEETNIKFQYFLAKQKHILIIAMIGAINDNAAETFAQLGNEVLADEDIKFYIINFRDVTKVLVGEGIRSLAKLQQTIRTKKESRLFLVSIKPDIKWYLKKNGIIRESEVANNLREILGRIASGEFLE